MNDYSEHYAKIFHLNAEVCASMVRVEGMKANNEQARMMNEYPRHTISEFEIEADNISGLSKELREF